MSCDSDIGRVRHHEVESLVSGVPKSASDEIRACRKPERRALSCAVSTACASMSVPMPVALRQFMQQREQDRARASAEIGDAQRARACGSRRSPRARLPPLFRYRAAARASRATAQTAGPRIPSSPRMRATGSPASRRAASCRDRLALRCGQRARCGRGEARCDRATAHGRSSRRASSAGDSIPAASNCAATIRRAAAISGAPARSGRLMPRRSARRAGRPGFPRPARR